MNLMKLFRLLHLSAQTPTSYIASPPPGSTLASCHPASLLPSSSSSPSLPGSGDWIEEEGREGRFMMAMEFKAAILTTAVLAVLLCSPALAQKTPSVALPPSTSPAPAPAPHYVDLAALLGVAGPFHTFLSYLQKTDVIETFQSQANKTDEGITIFVPKDSAFSALKKSTFANLTGDQLKQLLLYHAFPKYYPLATFRNLSVLNPVNTFAGPPYTLNLTDDMGTITVQSMWSKPKISSSVYATDPVAVYSINKVLLPMQLFSKDPPLAPAPAPAPQSGASDLAPSPGGAKAGGNGKADSTSSAQRVGVSGLMAAAAAGLMLLW